MAEKKEQNLILAATEENIDKVNDFLNKFLGELGFSERIQWKTRLAVEELYVNIASYAYGPETGDVEIRVTGVEHPTGVAISLIDGGMQYNPLEREDPDVDLPTEQRRIGGLGIFIVKQYVDDISYEYKDGKNILTIRQNL